MGPSTFPTPEAPPPPIAPPIQPPPFPVGYEQRREPKLRYIILFLLTVVTTTIAGVDHYLSYLVGFTDKTVDVSGVAFLLNGLWYALPAIAILGSHEMGHYLACRYYRVDSSAPYFIPFYIPLVGPLLFGTLGAVIRIRQPIPGKKALFDIGIAGPIAGFIVLVPLLMVGMYLSSVVPVPPTFDGPGVIYELGEPLLLQLTAWLTFGSIPEGYTLSLHPMAFAAWFGMLATALNLFPIGQLDGGHISYAVLGPRSTLVTLGTVLCLVGLTFVSSSWLVWTVLTVTMLAIFGPRHPRVFDEEVPLDRTRLWLALFAVVMFVLCFTPAPLELLDLVTS